MCVSYLGLWHGCSSIGGDYITRCGVCAYDIIRLQDWLVVELRSRIVSDHLQIRGIICFVYVCLMLRFLSSTVFCFCWEATFFKDLKSCISAKYIVWAKILANAALNAFLMRQKITKQKLHPLSLPARPGKLLFLNYFIKIRCNCLVGHYCFLHLNII